MANGQIEFLDKVKDTASGFVGVVTAKVEYVGGNRRVLLEAVSASGEHLEMWVDSGRLIPTD